MSQTIEALFIQISIGKGRKSFKGHSNVSVKEHNTPGLKGTSYSLSSPGDEHSGTTQFISGATKIPSVATVRFFFLFLFVFLYLSLEVICCLHHMCWDSHTSSSYYPLHNCSISWSQAWEKNPELCCSLDCTFCQGHILVKSTVSGWQLSVRIPPPWDSWPVGSHFHSYGTYQCLGIPSNVHGRDVFGISSQD